MYTVYLDHIYPHPLNCRRSIKLHFFSQLESSAMHFVTPHLMIGFYETNPEDSPAILEWSNGSLPTLLFCLTSDPNADWHMFLRHIKQTQSMFFCCCSFVHFIFRLLFQAIICSFLSLKNAFQQGSF